MNLEDVRKHLGPGGDKYPDERIGPVLAAEEAAQRSALDIPKTRPAALDEALLLRVAHNLAETGGKDIRRVGSRAEGVRDLEAPYSKRRAAGAEPPKPRGKKTAAKKPAAITAATTTKKENV